MNIFVLDANPRLAAEYMCNKHVVKMIVETAQLLSTAVTMHGGTVPYKSSFKNHPCTRWTAQTKANFAWLKEHGVALCDEYTFRYGKTHQCRAVIESLTNDLIPDGPLTEFVQAMPDFCKAPNAVDAYRNYYNKVKFRFAKWIKRDVPYWYHPELEEVNNAKSDN